MESRNIRIQKTPREIRAAIAWYVATFVVLFGIPALALTLTIHNQYEAEGSPFSQNGNRPVTGSIPLLGGYLINDGEGSSTDLTVGDGIATNTEKDSGDDTGDPSETTLPPPPRPLPIVSTGVGMSLSSTLYNLSDEELARRLDDMASLGATWLRIDLSWSVIEREQGTFAWGPVDRVVKAATARNMHVLGLLTDSPWWAREDGCEDHVCEPRDPNEFANFAARAAARYSAYGVHSWEIWNEPNISLFWQPAPNPDHYAKLLKLTYAAIKARDGKAIVVSGGLSPAATRGGRIAPVDFLRAVYDHGAGDSFDAVGDHPYSYPAGPSTYQRWNAWSQMAETPTSIRSVMAAYGDIGKKIWMTEYGAPTDGPGEGATLDDFETITDSTHVSEAVQAHMATEAVEITKNSPWAGPLIWYSYKDIGTDSGTIENFFGVLRNDGSRKPAYDALKRAIAGY